MAQPEFTTSEIETEEWRVIPDPRFDLYEVSNLGRVQRFFCSRGRKRHHILRQKLTWDGYWEVQLWKNAVGRYIKVHILVAVAFIGPRPKEKEVNHIDRIRSNSRAVNLEYLTRKENVQHSLCNYRRGENNSQAKLTAETVRAIRIDATQGMSYAAIGRKHNTSPSNARSIVIKRWWRHV